MRRGPVLLLIAACVLVAWASLSYWTDGVVSTIVHTSEDRPWLERIREVVAGWGPLAPIGYTLAVIVEVIVAPIPGTLLYAPAGAIFGGFLGGTLSLVGNIAGAAISSVLGRLIGERTIARRLDDSALRRYRDLLRRRGLWVVLVLRLNPLTTSDLVSYAAGMAGVPAWKVAVGTLFGLGPWCYLQAYFAQHVFEIVPGWVLLVSAAVLVVLVAWGHSTVTVTGDSHG